MTHSIPAWLDTANLPDWVNWIAQDADGQWWGYEAEPLEYHAGWYENEVGRRVRLAQTDSVTEWRKHLHRVL